MIGRSFGSALDAFALAYPSETALIHGDLRMTYDQMFGEIRRTGRAFLAMGLRAGDRLAFVMENSADLIAVMYGALWAGLTIVPLNARLSAQDQRYMLADVKARGLVFDLANAERAHQLLDIGIEFAIATASDAVPPKGYLLSALRDGQPHGPGAPSVDVDQECWVQYTGGTTGYPKGAVHSHRSVLTSLYSATVEYSVQPGEVTAHVAPLTHSGQLYVMPVWSRGGTQVVLGGYEPERLLHAIERERIESVLLVPTMLYQLLDLPNITDYDLSSLRTVTYGAAPIGAERLEQALDILGPVFVQAYGQTEAFGQITMLSKHDHLRAVDDPELLRSCGRPVSIADVRCADDELLTVADGEPGEILVKGPHLTSGYVNKPAETAEALRGGWLLTGDIGVRDERGYFFIVDRKKDMIVSGGFNVYPKEVERALFGHPAVADVCVIGVPDSKWGESVKAVVVARGGAEPSESELIAFVKEQKGSVLAPKSIDFVDVIPVTAAGKHDKKAVRANYWSGRARGVN
ncbi:AMP-binding protein [Nocardia sp. SC052]|uniref:AMP-binding protein n=1 Tax=Nocardia sichangensis TaxID=3385975 RepID=UPI0039A1210D